MKNFKVVLFGLLICLCFIWGGTYLLGLPGNSCRWRGDDPAADAECARQCKIIMQNPNAHIHIFIRPDVKQDY